MSEGTRAFAHMYPILSKFPAVFLLLTFQMTTASFYHLGKR